MSKDANGKLATRGHCDLRMDRAETVAALQEWLAQIDELSRSTIRAFGQVKTDAARSSLVGDFGAVSHERAEWEAVTKNLWAQWLISHLSPVSRVATPEDT